MSAWTKLEIERPTAPAMVKRHTGEVISNAIIVKNSAGNMEFWQVGNDEDQRYLLNPKVDHWMYDGDAVSIPLGQQVQQAARDQIPSEDSAPGFMGSQELKVDFETGEEVT